MIKARFKTDLDDYRSVNWPVKHPYWKSGETETASIVVAYADDEVEILRNWPDATDIESESVGKYELTSRFRKPDWFKE